MNRKQEYERLRRLGWTAINAWRTAGANTRFAELEARGLVRVVCEPDECLTIDDLFGEGGTERELKAFEARCERDGVWHYATEYLDPIDGWTHADSCGGFVGDDWQDSGYDADMKEAAIEALNAIDIDLCAGWV